MATGPAQAMAWNAPLPQQPATNARLSPRPVVRNPKVMPSMPRSGPGSLFTLQIASVRSIELAQEDIAYLAQAGLAATIEPYNGWHRVVLKDVEYNDLAMAVKKAGEAGFAEVWIR
jgi:cell division protein FtsN